MPVGCCKILLSFVTTEVRKASPEFRKRRSVTALPGYQLLPRATKQGINSEEPLLHLGSAYLIVVGGDEPQLQVQVVVPLLHADEVEDVVVLHAAHAVDLVLVLPGKLVLDGDGEGADIVLDTIRRK